MGHGVGRARVQHRAPEGDQRARRGSDPRRSRDRHWLPRGRGYADGSNSKLRDSLGLSQTRWRLPDGAIRLLIAKTTEERASEEGRKTVEYWSGSRRLLYTPCSDEEVYIAMTMLDTDRAARSVPIDKADWMRSFPRLAGLIARLGDERRYDRFELIKLRRWSAGRAALIGDAAHSLPPNLGQGGGFAMMNALSLAVYLDRFVDVTAALAAWEQNEGPLTERVQRISVLYGLPTRWPPLARSLFFRAAGSWLARQRMVIAMRQPTGVAA